MHWSIQPPYLVIHGHTLTLHSPTYYHKEQGVNTLILLTSSLIQTRALPFPSVSHHEQIHGQLDRVVQNYTAILSDQTVWSGPMQSENYTRPICKPIIKCYCIHQVSSLTVGGCMHSCNQSPSRLKWTLQAVSFLHRGVVDCLCVSAGVKHTHSVHCVQTLKSSRLEDGAMDMAQAGRPLLHRQDGVQQTWGRGSSDATHVQWVDISLSTAQSYVIYH